MKNLMSIIAASLLTVGVASAQERGGRQNRSPEEMSKMQVERLTEQLSLNKAQQDSIYKYTLIASQAQRKVFEEAGDNREAAFEKMQKLREESNKNIKKFLSEEQIKKYDELLKQRGNRPQRPQQ